MVSSKLFVQAGVVVTTNCLRRGHMTGWRRRNEKCLVEKVSDQSYCCKDEAGQLSDHQTKDIFSRTRMEVKMEHKSGRLNRPVKVQQQKT